MPTHRLHRFLTPAALAFAGITLVATPGCDEREATDPVYTEPTDRPGDGLDMTPGLEPEAYPGTGAPAPAPGTTPNPQPAPTN